MITPPITISNKISPTLTTGTLVTNFKKGFRGYGSNLAVLGNIMDAAGWLTYGSFGQNLARLHHLATALRKGWMTVDQLVLSLNTMQASGIRGCMDLIDNLGETTPWGLYGFKERICAFDPEAEAILENYIQDSEQILKHPSIFMIGIGNEMGQWLTSPDHVRRLYARWAPIIRAFNSKVMVYTTNDLHTKPSEFINAIAEEDAFCVNFYPTEDFNTSARCSYVNEGWHLKGVKWLADWLKGNGTPKPVFITEFGSWNVNPFSVENEIAVAMFAAAEGWSTFGYAYSTGSPTDKYSMQSDPVRLKTLAFGGYLNKNRTGMTVTLDGNKFSATGSKVEMPDRKIARVNSYVFRTDSCPDWARLTKTV